MNSLGWDVTHEYRPYFYGGQVSGYTQTYEGDLTIGTVNGCGHMAPQWKRAQTWHLVFEWVNGSLLE
jgi:serine carboxypeptidase-like clade 1